VIVVDTSALMAIVLGEAQAGACIDALAEDPEVLISAVTLAEALIVAERRGVSEEMRHLLEAARFRAVAVSDGSARQVARAYATWGKGVGPAGLNFGDCFPYVLAKDNACPLLFVGDDFRKTDVKAAL
jgi:ribonuclease VapC